MTAGRRSSIDLAGPVSPGDADSGIALVNVTGETGGCLLSTNKTDISTSRTANIGASVQPWNNGYFVGDVFVKSNDNEFAKIEPAGVLKLQSNNSSMATADAFRVTNASADIARIGYDGKGTFGSGTIGASSNSNVVQIHSGYGQIQVQSDSGGNALYRGYNSDGTATFTVRGNGNSMFAGEMMLTGLTTTPSISYPAGWISSSQVLALNTSSARYKRDIETADPVLCLDIVNKLRPVWYRSAIETDNPNESYWGFIAEEVAEVEPRLTCYDAEGLPGSVDYARFTPVLTSVLQQALARIEALEAQLAQLTGGAN